MEKGDVVKLKSGGPDMTVVGNGDIRMMKCYWFSGCDLMEAVFHYEALEYAAENVGDE